MTVREDATDRGPVDWARSFGPRTPRQLTDAKVSLSKTSLRHLRTPHSDQERARGYGTGVFDRELKRSLDVVVAGLGLILLSPVAIACAVVIWAKMGRPVFFRQRRLGFHERPFTLIKFRTMGTEQSLDGDLLPDGQRLTEVGRFLRRTSLDELPTFWNVLRGDMSLVGPRPLLMRYLPYFTPEERRRFSVRPGVTGLAQVRGRNELSWSHRLAADIEYVDRWSLALDLSILGRTLAQVVRAQGVVEDTNTVMRDLDEERSAGGGL
jgi:sugar transferase EpsL